MKIDTKDVVSVSQASAKGISWLVTEAANGTTKVIVKNSEPSVVVTSIANMTRLENIEELASDLRLLAATLARQVADTGERYNLDTVLKELGIDVESDE